MLPPSNNRDNPLLQYLEKLAAVTHRPRHLPPSTRPPPPPYTASFSSQDSDQDWDEDYDYDEDYDEYYEAKPEHRAISNSNTSSIHTPATNSNTITIDLNSSIQIKGDANTIIIASGSVHQQHTSYHGSSTRTLRPERPPPPPAAAAMSSNLANTTCAIVAALQKSGVLSAQSRSGSGPGSGAAPSVNINIDAGIRVDGVRNVVCFGAGSLPLAKRYHDAARRKRRAQSEPLVGGEEKRTRLI
ncbi:hypothetical protein BJY00DRAFT_45280 [Aspergillus carlsbadensis]|nr:hypothetical protein BJY00DRAFT_45280 [Aspergillus carlsbadensis]